MAECSAATEVATSSAFLRGLLDGMRCGILAVDRDGRLEILNDVGATMLGIDVPEPGRPLGEALADFPEIARVMIDSFAMSHLPNRAELALGDGKRTIGFTLSFIEGHAGEPRGVAMFFKDLARIEQREEQDRLKDRLAALGQMAASMAHEIRNPLASIDVTCTLLRRKLGPAHEGMEPLNKIAAEVRRLNATITSSLEFVRPLQLRLERGPLHRVLIEAVAVACGRVGLPADAVTVQGEAQRVPLMIDQDRMRQVFENLILNALEAIPADGRVRVEVEHLSAAPVATLVPYLPSGPADAWDESDEQIAVRVVDDGPGIPAEQRDRVFYPFYTTKEKGSGVGLSTVKKIVDGHRGLIDIEDVPGGGTAFTVRLPLVRNEPED